LELHPPNHYHPAEFYLAIALMGRLLRVCRKGFGVKIIRMAGILLLVVTGLAILEPQETFAQG
jgi:hypothetical protein